MCLLVIEKSTRGGAINTLIEDSKDNSRCLWEYHLAAIDDLAEYSRSCWRPQKLQPSDSRQAEAGLSSGSNIGNVFPDTHLVRGTMWNQRLAHKPHRGLSDMGN